MSTFLASNSDNDVIIAAIAIGGSFVVAVVSVISVTIRKVITARAREESRREIAAYVAEGSISADDASRILAAGGSVSDQIKERLREKLGT